MGNNAILEIVLRARDEATKTIQQLNGTLGEATKRAGDMSGAFKAAGGIILSAGIAGVGALKMLADAASQHQVAEASVDATLKNVSDSARNAAFSYANLREQTNAVSDAYLKLGFADNESSLAFAQDLRVTKDITDAHKMFQAAADLSRLKHIDLASANQLLTMAYEGNTRALKSLGIEVAKGAKGMENINAVEQAAAGQADAFSKTWAGSTQVLTVELDRLKETLGARLIPSLTQFTTSVVGILDHLNKLSPKTYDIIVNILKFGTAFALIAGPLLLVIGFLPALAGGFALVSGALLPLTLIVGAVALAGYLIYTNWGRIAPLLQSLKPVFDSMVKTVTDFVTKNKATFEDLWITVRGLFTVSLALIRTIWQATWQTLVAILKDAWQTIEGVLQIAWGIIEIIANVGMAIFTGNWSKAWQGIQAGFADVWKGIQNTFEGSTKLIINGAILMVNEFIGIINGLIKGINSIGSKIHVGVIPTIAPIPAFEQGGYVPNTGLAMLHAGEYVLSKDMLAGKQNGPSMVSNTHNSPINIYATISSDIDMNLLGQKVAFALRNSR